MIPANLNTFNINIVVIITFSFSFSTLLFLLDEDLGGFFFCFEMALLCC